MGNGGRPVSRGPVGAAGLKVTPSELRSGSAGFPRRPGAGGCRRGLAHWTGVEPEIEEAP